MSFSIPSLLSRLPLVILLFNLGEMLSPHTAQAQTSPAPTIAQAPNTQTPNTLTPQCYWSTLQMGVYLEPNPLSTALGILPAGAIVLIGPGSGQGWVRLQSPLVGWMTAAGLQANPLKDCNGLGTIVPVSANTPSGNSNPASGTIALGTPSGTGGSAPVPNTPILCTVTAPSGLAVRNQPILHPRTLTAILEPGLHRFEFSDRQVRLESSNQVRDWFYITAPVTGWISPRVVDNPSVELTGEGCF